MISCQWMVNNRPCPQISIGVLGDKGLCVQHAIIALKIIIRGKRFKLNASLPGKLGKFTRK